MWDGRVGGVCHVRVEEVIFGSETWPMKVEDKQRLERAERMMLRHVWSHTEGQEVL
jgi:hypothetical protein